MLRRSAKLAAMFEPVVAMAAFAILIIVVAANVVLRYVTGRSLVFTEEIAYISFGYLIFLGSSLLFREKALIAIDLVVDALPPTLQRLTNVATYAVLIGVTSFFALLSLDLAASSWLRTTAFLRIPYFWIYLAPAISFTLMAIYSLAFLVATLRSPVIAVAHPQEQL